jgi:hypothetical protein
MIRRSILSPAISLLWFIAIGFFALDAFGSHATIADRLGFSSTIFGIIAVAGLFVVRVVSSVNLASHANRISAYLGALALIIGLLIGILEYHTPDNHWYELTRINPAVLVTFAHLSFLVWVINLPSKTASLLVKKIVYLFPLWLIGISAWVSLLPFDAFISFTIEDGPVENAQVLILLSTALVTGKEAISSPHVRHRLLFYALTIALLLVALEEISWGQRLLGFETPESIKAINVQNETNIHNIGILNQLQMVGYITISSLGVISGFRKPKTLWMAPTSAARLLLIPAIFYMYFFISPNLYFSAEIVEVLFYGGISLWIIHITQTLPQLHQFLFKD